MVEHYTLNDLISDLKQIHNIIMGTTGFGDPLFQQLAKLMDEYEGDAFDNFIATIFGQFNFVLGLEIRAIRMLRSFLVLTESGLQYKTDITSILENLGSQREKCDPMPTFKWYLDFKLIGGQYKIRALTPNHFLYMEWGNQRVSGWPADPGHKGHFHIQPCDNNAGFIVTCRYYPGECMRLESNKVDSPIKSTQNSEDTQCHWLFHRAKNMGERVFRLSTVKWPDHRLSILVAVI